MRDLGTLSPSRVAWTLALALAVISADAFAGGFELPDNGARAVGRGSAFTVRADDLTAIAHNPGGLSRLRGTHLLYSHNVIHAPMSFTRAQSAVATTATTGAGGEDPLATVENLTPWFALGGMFVAATDFGLEDWTFAIGAYGPNAAGSQRWPLMGGQRWMLVELDALIVYYSLAASYGKKDKWGVGVTMQLAHQPETRLSLVVDGTTGGPQQPYYSQTDALATISLSAPLAPTLIVGGWVRPIPELEFAASGRVVPVRLKASGDVAMTEVPGSIYDASDLEITNSAARLTLVLPPTARAGVRYRHLEGEKERFDLELNVVYEAWSMMKSYVVELDGVIAFAAQEAPDVTIEKRWKDTLSVRLGGTYNLDAPLSLSAGAFYETGAVPEVYTHLDFPSFDRLGLSAGASGTVGNLTWTVAYSHIFQGDRRVDERYAKVLQQRPVSECPEGCDGYDAVPANAGTFTSSFDTFSLSLGYAF